MPLHSPNFLRSEGRNIDFSLGTSSETDIKYHHSPWSLFSPQLIAALVWKVPQRKPTEDYSQTNFYPVPGWNLGLISFPCWSEFLYLLKSISYPCSGATFRLNIEAKPIYFNSVRLQAWLLMDSHALLMHPFFRWVLRNLVKLLMPASAITSSWSQLLLLTLVSI